uniref:FAS1 domain-containing protein n=1 Tax=Picea sitchensis TaxID=3332 RepID=B8LLV7_PICSI|nr:unknown [Picea sitchensis]
MKFLGLGFAFLLLLSFLCSANAFNITKILAKYPEYSKFNHDLSQTKLADEINSRQTITVLALSNSEMALLSGLDLASLKRVLSLHVVLDFFDAKKLHEITNGTTLSTTLYQTTGNAPGNTGFINITDLKAGKVGFGPAAHGAKLDATYVKSVKQEGYNISVIEVSKPITTNVAEAPAPAPADVNITAVLIKGGCRIFATMISTTGVLKTFEDAVQGGLTVFCPTDAAFTGATNKLLKKLTSDDQVSVLEFHGLPIYSPLGTLKTTNGPIRTMASPAARKYVLTVSSSGDTVILNTGVSKATISGTLLDDQPLAIFTVNKLLEPKELFVAAPTPAPTPAPVEAPTPEAESPEATPNSSPPAPAGPAESPTTEGPASSETSSPSFAPASAGICRGLLAFLVACVGVLVFML